MVQQYMKENEMLKKELEGALADIKDLEENGGRMPEGKRRRSSVVPSMLPGSKGLIDMEPIMETDSEESVRVEDHDRQMEQIKAEMRASAEKDRGLLKAQVENLRKNVKKSESSLSLKAVEIAQIKKELKALRQAKELCETLHVFDEEEDVDDDEAGDIVEELALPGSSHMTARSNAGDGASGKTTSRSLKSAESSRTRRPSMSMKQQKAIADMIKSRDEAEQKVTKIRDRVNHLEKTNKKLNKTIKALHKEIGALKEAASANLGAALDPSIGAPTDASSDRVSSQRLSEKDDVAPLKSDRTSTRSTARRMSRRASAKAGITERSHYSNTSAGSGTSTRTQSASIRNGAAETDRSSRRGASRRSYSVAPPSVTVDDLGNLTVEDLQKEIRKLKEEVAMWRKIGQKDDDDIFNRSPDTLRAKYSKSAGLGQHKPLMVNKPELKKPKAKHRVEKKWKMTKSRFLHILKGEHTKRSLKSKRWILKTMNEIFDSKYKSDKNCLRENRAILALPEFIYHEYIPSRFGIKNLVDAMCWDIHKAVEHYSDATRSAKSGINEEEYKEIVTFKRFLEEDLSLTDLSFYLKARKVLTESKSLLLDGGFIPFKCINVLLDNIFDGTFKEYRLGISLKLQATALLQSDNTVIHKDLFLDFILKENQYLLHEFEASVQSLYFHFNLNNKDIIKREDSTRALQYILKGLPTKSMDEIINVIQNSDSGSESEVLDKSHEDLQSFFVKPYVQFFTISKNLFSWKQQFFVPNFSYNANLVEFNFEVMRAVSTRWNEFKGNMIVPILEMFEKHSNAYCVLNGHRESANNNIKDLLGITKIICRIRDYFEDMDRLISLCMGWDVFMLYTSILSAIIQGFEILDQYELKRLISRQDLNQTQCSKAVDNYLYLYEDYVMKRLRRAVTVKRAGSASGTIATPNNAALSQYLHLKQQVLQN